MTALVLCECGCGMFTKLSDRTDSGRKVKKGQPLRYITGHNGIRHGATKGRRRGGQATSEYNAYCNAISRCTNPNHPGYFCYGGRGIKFLFSSYEEWIEELGPKPSHKHSVDRIDNERHYEPGNMRWATAYEQVHNRGKYGSRQRCF